MDKVLGYDCDDNEIYEYQILHAIWANYIDIKDLEGADPRHYCAVIADDGNAYAISVHDWWNKDLIRERETIKENEEIPIIVKPISEMVKYELAECSDGAFYYNLDRAELKRQLNSIINKNKNKVLTRNKGGNIRK